MKIKKRQNPRKIKGFSDFCLMELVTGIGPVTPTLPRWCSTAEPHQQMLFFDWILRLNWVSKKCCFCFTKVVLYRWATPADAVFWLNFAVILSSEKVLFLFYQLKNIFEKLQSYLLQLPKILAKSLVFFLLGT